jgi:hypothetical protein
LNEDWFTLPVVTIGVAKLDATSKALMSTELFKYKVFVLKYLKVSVATSKSNVSVDNLFDMMLTVLLSVGILPAPCGPTLVLYLETNGLAVPEMNVTPADCNGEM